MSTWYRLLVLVTLSTGCGRVGYDAEREASVDSMPPPQDVGQMDSQRPDAADSAPPDSSARDSSAVDTSPVLDAGPCFEDPCRLVLPQCGCGAGEMCTRLIPRDPTRACAPSGANATGDACTFSTECAPGNSCVQVNGAGICILWCESDADCPVNECIEFRVADTVGGCRVSCDPVADTGCPAGMSCYAFLAGTIAGATVTMTTCGNAGSANTGAPCAVSFDCTAGHACPSGTCEPVCERGGAPCASGSCAAISWAPVDGVDLGVCR